MIIQSLEEKVPYPPGTIVYVYPATPVAPAMLPGADPSAPWMTLAPNGGQMAYYLEPISVPVPVAPPPLPGPAVGVIHMTQTKRKGRISRQRRELNEKELSYAVLGGQAIEHHEMAQMYGFPIGKQNGLAAP